MSEFENSSGEEDWLPPTQPGRAFSVSVEESCSRREVDEGTDGGDEFSEDDMERQIEGKPNNDYLECEDEEVAALTAADTIPSIEEGKGKSLLSHIYKHHTMPSRTYIEKQRNPLVEFALSLLLFYSLQLTISISEIF